VVGGANKLSLNLGRHKPAVLLKVCSPDLEVWREGIIRGRLRRGTKPLPKLKIQCGAPRHREIVLVSLKSRSIHKAMEIPRSRNKIIESKTLTHSSNQMGGGCLSKRNHPDQPGEFPQRSRNLKSRPHRLSTRLHKQVQGGGQIPRAPRLQ